MTICTPAVLKGIDQTTLQKWLLEAQTALHDVMSGGKPVTVIVTGGGQHREVTFDKTSLPNLTIWISQLQAALGISVPRRRALRPYF